MWRAVGILELSDDKILIALINKRNYFYRIPSFMCAFIPAAACSGIITGAFLGAVLAFLLLMALCWCWSLLNSWCSHCCWPPCYFWRSRYCFRPCCCWHSCGCLRFFAVAGVTAIAVVLAFLPSLLIMVMIYVLYCTMRHMGLSDYSFIGLFLFCYRTIGLSNIGVSNSRIDRISGQGLDLSDIGLAQNRLASSVSNTSSLCIGLFVSPCFVIYVYNNIDYWLYYG
jgi:hypothetical protein